MKIASKQNRLSTYGLVAIGILVVVIGLTAIALYRPSSGSVLPSEETASLDELVNSDRAGCNVLGIDMYGTLLTYIPQQNIYSEDYDPDIISSKYVTYYIDKANEANDIDAIILDVDSGGGYPVAGEEIAEAIKASLKPVVAVIRQRGLSAAYWAVSSADRIFASNNSDVGSIGVTSSYVDNVGSNSNQGNAFIELTAGEYKDAGNPNRTLTEEERLLWISDLERIHQNFIAAVANNRGIPLEEVQKIADGWSVLGLQALEQKLIDTIGGFPEAEAYLEELLGQEPEICWY